MGKHYDYTPDLITSLEENEVFVFGSNLQGYHGGGAARFALHQFGAMWGQGEGLQGQSYAIPTMQGPVDTIRPHVDKFISFARGHKELLFLVTPIGCGIAGFSPSDIAPLFAQAINDDNIVLPKSFVDIIKSTRPAIPKYLITKIHGQTATLVDMLIEMNKDEHFTSAADAMQCLDNYLERLYTSGDPVAFNCSIRSLYARTEECFSDGKLDVVKLQECLKDDYYTGIERVYMEYVVEKTVKLVEMMNECRQYTSPKDVADDFLLATGGVNHCGPQTEYYYFGISTDEIGFVKTTFYHYLSKFWHKFAPNGILDNNKFRDFMIGHHERGIAKYGLDAVINHDYQSGSPCHPDIYDPARNGAGPRYVRDKETRQWIRACGVGLNDRDITRFEYGFIVKCLCRDPKFILVPSCYTLYLVPRRDMTLPAFSCGSSWYDTRKLTFKNEREKENFVKELLATLPPQILDTTNGYELYQTAERYSDEYYWVAKDAEHLPIFKYHEGKCEEATTHTVETKRELINNLKHVRL